MANRFFNNGFVDIQTETTKNGTVNVKVNRSDDRLLTMFTLTSKEAMDLGMMLCRMAQMAEKGE